ncbi:MAG: PEP-CTERM system TPR-repeat protein PrsT [Thiobacillaceae bacterium]|nr:PEP-CTERM system TPR-repeat protein PrsT [Thiobacillaceae bacterium]
MRAHRSFSLSTLAMLALLTLAGCGKSPESRLEDAKAAYQAADYKTATIELKNVLEEAPENMEARLLIGRSLQAQEQWSESEKHLKKALELGASAEQILPWLAHTLNRQGKHQEVVELKPPSVGLGSKSLASLLAERANAYLSLKNPAVANSVIEEAERVIANSGSAEPFPPLLLARARLAFMQGNAGAAEEWIGAALRQDPNDVDSLYMRANLLLAKGNKPEAIKTYQRITELKPGDTLTHLSIAELTLQSADLKSAESAIAAAERNGGNPILVSYSRARLEYAKGNMKAAQEALQQVLRGKSDHMPSLLLHAAINYELGNYEQSLKSASLVLAQHRDNVHAARLVAASQLRRGEPKAALEQVLPLLKAAPEEAALHALAGEAYLLSRQYAKAMEHLDRAAQIKPADSSIRQLQAQGNIALGRVDQAVKELERSAEMSDQPGADMPLILTLLRQQRYDQALRAIEVLEKKLPDNPVTHNLRAAAYLGKKDHAAARKALERALAVQPDFHPAAANLAKLDLLENKPDAARKRFEAILAKDPGNVRAMMDLARMAAVEKNRQAYVSWLERAAKADGQAIPPRQALVEYHIQNQDARKALAVARELANAHPRNPAALNLLGNAQLASGDTTSALSTFTRVAELAPASAAAHYRLGLAQARAGAPAKARTAYERALAIQPDHADALDGLIRLDLAENKHAAALARTRALQSAMPTSPLGPEREGRILMLQKQYAAAAQAFDKALTRGAGSATLIELHKALLLAGNAAAAEQRLSRWMQSHPRDEVILAYAAEQQLRNRRYPAAIAHYQALLKLLPNSVLAHNNLANAYLFTQDTANALAMAEKAYALDKNSIAVQDTLGWILLQRGETQRALELIGGALAKAPKSPGIRYHHAVALAKSGDRARARKEIEKLLGENPDFPEIESARRFLKEP